MATATLGVALWSEVARAWDLSDGHKQTNSAAVEMKEKLEVIASNYPMTGKIFPIELLVNPRNHSIIETIKRELSENLSV